ncbi:MAG: Hsp20/alpha crystallin family protein [Pseudomonadota bacterium]
MNDVVRRNDPFDLFGRFGDLFEREPLFSPANRSEWLPPVDIKETDENYTLHMDVPGLKPDDLDVELHDGVLSIRGSRSEEKTETEKGYVRTERRQGSFSRQFRVPTHVQAEALKAEVKDGVLTIEVPKGAEQGARKVVVS